MDKFRIIKVLDAAPYERFNVVLKSSYRRTSILRATRPRETAFPLNPVVDELKTKGRVGVRTDQPLVKARRFQTLEEAGCFLPLDGLQINFYKLLRMNRSGSSRNVLSETAVVERLRKHLSTDGVYGFADVIRA